MQQHRGVRVHPIFRHGDRARGPAAVSVADHARSPRASSVTITVSRHLLAMKSSRPKALDEALLEEPGGHDHESRNRQCQRGSDGGGPTDPFRRAHERERRTDTEIHQHERHEAPRIPSPGRSTNPVTSAPAMPPTVLRA